MCIFCEIVKGNIPCYKVYEDDNFLAFLDISQVTKGHTLVIPKKHFASLFELDDFTASNILPLVKKTATAVKKATNASGINIINNNGAIAGQSVDHFHIHIIPRYANDNFKIDYPSNKTSNEDFIMLSNTIKDNYLK